MNLLTIGSNMLLCTWAPGGGGGARVDARPPLLEKQKQIVFHVGVGLFSPCGGQKNSADAHGCVCTFEKHCK